MLPPLPANARAGRLELFRAGVSELRRGNEVGVIFSIENHCCRGCAIAVVTMADRTIALIRVVRFIWLFVYQLDMLSEVINRFAIPSSKFTRGSQPRIFFAAPISVDAPSDRPPARAGIRFRFCPVIRMISSANCLIVISRGLPNIHRFMKSLIASRKIPSIKSLTYKMNASASHRRKC